MRKIALVTSTRAEYGILSRLIGKLEEDPAIELQLIVTGTHLSEKFGNTIKEITYPVTKKIDIEIEKTPAHSLALCIEKFDQALRKLRPDLLVILGDRYEIMGVAQAAMLNNIPIAHLYGGDTTEGAIDEAIRHSITKMSHLHFTSCEESRKRVIQLGENPERVFNFGALAIENIKNAPLLSKEELLQSVSVAVNEEETTEDEEEEAEKLFEKDETEILDNVLAFDSLKVKDIYIPMEKVHSIDITGLTADMVNEEILSHDFSRIPVYEDSKDNIVGILVVRTYFEEYSQDKHLNIRSILESPAFIEKDLPIDDAFENLNREHVHLGIVTDAGKPIGVISMEDILEELVDDIAEDNSIKKARKAA